MKLRSLAYEAGEVQVNATIVLRLDNLVYAVF